MDSKKDQQKEIKHKDRKNGLEWTVFGLSLLMLVGIFGYLGYHAFEHQKTPPELEIEMITAASTYSPYRYHVIVHNRGGATAAEAQLEFVMKSGTTILDKAQLSFPWVPQSSKREGWVIFSINPAKSDTIIASVVGYKKP